MKRTKSDEELKKFLKKLNEKEKHALKFGLLPEEKTPEELTGKDMARLMEMNPKEHF